MPSIYLQCPQCGDEIEVLMEWVHPDRETNSGGGWYADGFVGHFDCHMTLETEEALATEAEKRAFDDEEFGVTVPDPEFTYAPAVSPYGPYKIWSGR